MKNILILISVILFVSSCSAYKLGATTFIGDINMTDNQIHNLDNPSSDYDAATKKYVDSISTDSFLPKTGGTMTGQINFGAKTASNVATPVNDTDVAIKSYVDTVSSEYLKISDYYMPDGPYAAFIMYNGTHAVAKWNNGTLITTSTDNDTALQAVQDAVHASSDEKGYIILSSYFTSIDTTINQYGDAPFRGIGYTTGIEGTADPLIKYVRSGSFHQGIALQDMTLRTTGASNDAFQSYQGANGAKFMNVNFTTDGSAGSLLNLTWWNDGMVSHCCFTQEDADSTGIGLKIWGAGTTYQSINQFVTMSSFSYLSRCISVTTDTSANVAGIYVSNSMLGFGDRAVYVKGGGAIYLDQLMIDGIDDGLYLDDVDGLSISNSYIGVDAVDGYAVYVGPDQGDCHDIFIDSVKAVNYGTSSEWAICINSVSDDIANVVHVINSKLMSFAGGVKVTQTGGSHHLGMKFNDNTISSCSYASFFINGAMNVTIDDNTVLSCGVPQYVHADYLQVRDNSGLVDV